MAESVLCIDIGGTKIRLAVVVDHSIRRRVEAMRAQLGEAEQVVAYIKKTGAALIQESNVPIRACGVGFGGPVDFAGQKLNRSMHVAGWEGVPLPEVLSEHFGIPCVIENDAMAGAIGEYHFGAGQGTQTMVYLTVSTGIGGGLILDGKPYRGSFGLAGEVGHMPVVSSGGRMCTCGSTGCLEAYCSGPAIARRAEEYLSEKLVGGDHTRDQLTARTVFERAAAGDPHMQMVVTETGAILGAALTGVINLLDPECIVIGGGVSQAGDPLFAGINEAVRVRLGQTLARKTRIVPAALGDDSVLYGAAYLAGCLVE